MPPTVDSASASPRGFDVFINHRGSDVKKTIASHLYHRLLSHGLQVFLDDPELERGEDFPPQIAGAIATASVHVAIFSPGYAQSRWCLDELVDMLESKESRGATIIPVFYKVDPFELRWTDKGKYGEDLRHLETKGRYDRQTFAKWRGALAQVSDISGFKLEDCNSDEGELVEMVAQKVLKKVSKPPLPVSEHLTGLDEKLQDFEKTVLLEQQHQRRKANVVVIVGPGGLGIKTTLATIFFNRKKPDYQQACFLHDVREYRLNTLQMKLYKDLTGRDQVMDTVYEGIAMLKNRLLCGRALIVLDDVDDDKQLDALFSPVRDVLPPGSLIIVISRTLEVLARSGIEKSSFYEMTGLDKGHSQVLFCLHAFGQRGPVVGFEELVGNFLDVCAGLPLSLKVLGAGLRGEKSKYWKGHLDKITEAGLPTDIQRTLKSSYDSLDKEEKDIFLDIACFFVGIKRDTAIRIWDGCGWRGRLGFRNLEKKCLVQVDSNKCIRMHDHLRDLGRHLAEREPPECGRRLWRPTDEPFPNVLTSSTVRGISVVQQRSGESFQSPVEFAIRIVDMSGLQLLRIPGDYLRSISVVTEQPDLLWLRCESYTYSSLPSWPIPLRNLRVLEVEGREGEVEAASCLETLWETEIEAPLELRELNIRVPVLRVPESIWQLKYLEKIELHNIKETLPEEFSDLRSLKHLKLCGRMVSLPNSLGNLTNLQHIDLSLCHNLKMLPPSFRRLSRLKHLSLEYCLNLTLSDETFGNITALKRLNLTSCKKIERLPSQVTRQQSLKELILNDTAVKELPNAIGDLRKLKILEIAGPPLKILPPSLGMLQSLEQLTLKFCKDIKYLPSITDWKELTMLKMVDLTVECLPVGVTELDNLESLVVENCPIREVPFASVEKVQGGIEELLDVRGRRLLDPIHNYMLGLRYLYLRGTRIIELSFAEGVCPNLQTLDLGGCRILVEVGSLPTTLLSLRLRGCRALKKLTGLSRLAKLQTIDMRECTKVQALPGLEALISLKEFKTSKCNNMKRIRDLAWKSKPESDILKKLIKIMETQEEEEDEEQQQERNHALECLMLLQQLQQEQGHALELMLPQLQQLPQQQLPLPQPPLPQLQQLPQPQPLQQRRLQQRRPQQPQPQLPQPQQPQLPQLQEQLQQLQGQLRWLRQLPLPEQLLQLPEQLLQLQQLRQQQQVLAAAAAAAGDAAAAQTQQLVVAARERP